MKSKIIILLIFSTSFINTLANTKTDITVIIRKINDKNPKIRRSMVMKYTRLERNVALDNIQFLLPRLTDTDIEIKKLSTMIVGTLFLKKTIGKDVYLLKNYSPEKLKVDSRYIKAANYSIPYLIKNLKDVNDVVRECAAVSLGQIGFIAKDSVPVLITTLNDKSVYVREKAIIALGNIGQTAKKAIPFLKKLLNDNNKDIRYAAEKSIQLITSVP